MNCREGEADFVLHGAYVLADLPELRRPL